MRLYGIIRGMTRRAGFTLMEIVVCIVLISVCTILVVSIIPEGVVSIKKAENVEMATMYATEVADTVSSGTTVASPIDVTLNHTAFHVTTDVTAVDSGSGLNIASRLQQANVTVTWPDQEVPVRVATRWFAP